MQSRHGKTKSEGDGSRKQDGGGIHSFHECQWLRLANVQFNHIELEFVSWGGEEKEIEEQDGIRLQDLDHQTEIYFRPRMFGAWRSLASLLPCGKQVASAVCPGEKSCKKAHLLVIYFKYSRIAQGTLLNTLQ